MSLLLPNTRSLVTEFDSFLDAIQKSALIFEALFRDYLREDQANLEVHLDELSDLESRADDLRREIRFKLYSRMLIPENRGDVLSILENADQIIDALKKTAVGVDIEHPFLPKYMRPGLQDLVKSAVAAVDFTIQAANSYLRDPGRVQDFLTKVHFHEHEADKLENSLKRAVFAAEDENRLSAKMQLSFLVESISEIADVAEAVSDRISIAAIKREY